MPGRHDELSPFNLALERRVHIVRQLVERVLQRIRNALVGFTRAAVHRLDIRFAGVVGQWHGHHGGHHFPSLIRVAFDIGFSAVDRRSLRFDEYRLPRSRRFEREDEIRTRYDRVVENYNNERDKMFRDMERKLDDAIRFFQMK